jgi:hypothetical protein
MDECVAACVTFEEALTVFASSRVLDGDDAGLIKPICCGADVDCSGSWLGSKATCPRCGAEIRDAVAPMTSPFLERGNSFVTVPSEEFIKLFGDRTWIVMHEGDRP